jgi:hypothetical protein
VLDGERGAFAASVSLRGKVVGPRTDTPERTPQLASDRLWRFDHDTIGQLDAHTLKSRPGGEGFVGARVEGEWPPGGPAAKVSPHR